MNDIVKVLRDGGVILYPTDTIWGLGCDATNPLAVEKIYRIKHRPDRKALILLASSLDMIGRYVKEIPSIAVSLVEVNDRPMTIIYPNAIAGKAPKEGETPKGDKYCLAHNVVAEDGSVGIRIPLMQFCRDLARKLGRPLVSTSANVSGTPAPKTYKDISPEILNAVDLTVDPSMENGATGLPSQIIKLGTNGEVVIMRG